MANPKVSFSISACPGIINKLISVLYNTLAPAAELARIVDSSTHASPVNQEFDNIDPGTYIVKIYQSVDGVTLGTIQHDFWIDANTNQIISERIFFMVDGPDADDPANGTVDYINAYLNGKTISGIFQEGFRFLQDGIEWIPRTGGGFTLQAGLVFNQYQVWSVDVAYTVSATPVASNDIYGNIIAVPGNLTIGATHYNASLYCNCAATTQTITLPFSATIPDGKAFLIIHDGGNQINVAIKTQAGELFRFRGADKTIIHLGVGESIKFIKKGTKFYCIDDKGQWNRLGEQVAAEIVIQNSLVMDGATTYDGLVYLRAYDFIANNIPGAQKTDFATWAASKQTLYAIDTTAKTFKTPNRLNMSTRFVKTVGGSDASRPDNVPGGYQADKVGPHVHTFPIGNGTGPTKMPDENPADGNIQRDLASTNTNGPDLLSGLETTVKNIGALPLLLI